MMAEKREERFRMNRHAPFDRTFCRAHVAASVQRDASSPEWKFLHSSHSCTTTLQMAELSPPASPPPSLELAQTTMASHQKRGRQNQTLLSDAVEISVQTGRRGHGALWLLCHVDLRFIIKHTHAHTHGLKISAQASANQSKVKLDMLKIFCHFKQIVSCDVSRKCSVLLQKDRKVSWDQKKESFCTERKSQTFYWIGFGVGNSLQSESDNSGRLSHLRFQTHGKCKNSQFLKGV